MQPQISTVRLKISFALSESYSASLYDNIESIGSILYHHLLMIYGADGERCLCFGSEWNGANPTYKEEPMFGVFSKGRHLNLGGSVSWLDDALFVLQAFGIAREILRIDDCGLAEGEVWALSEIQERLQRPREDEALVLHRSEYEEVLSLNDKRLLAYRKASSTH